MRVLLADDDLVNRTLLRKTLAEWGYEVVAVADGDEAWHIFQEPNPPRLAILDWMMPGLNGLQLCKAIRAAQREPYTYLLLLTSRTQSADVVEGLEAGADDYITKPVHLAELRARLGAGRRVLQLQDELIAAREALRVQATRDPLTGLWNRGAIIEHLQRELARAERQGDALGALVIDLDHFKQVNDTYGHLTGDEVLRETAQRLRGALRTYDEVGRFGGEEFLAILSLARSGPALHRRICERLRLAVCEVPVGTIVGQIAVTISLGLAVSDVNARLGAEELLHAADQALYGAKRAGRNRFAIAGQESTPPGSPETGQQAERRLLRLASPPRSHCG